MRILICDDDEMIISQLKKLIIEYFQKNKLTLPEFASYSNGEKMLLDSGDKDIVFLDVEMPGPSGIYVGNSLKIAYPNAIVFIVTSFMEYLDDAMKFHVFRYISKPIEKNRLFRNLKDAIELYYSINITIAVETKEGVFTIPTREIVMIEAQNRKVIVKTTNNEYQSVKPMQYWQDNLPANNFFQTHKSFIVNMNHINSFDHYSVNLCDGQFQAYLTKRKYRKFKEAYFMFLGTMR